jgi:transcriptional regulator with XRE-family HTH domain
MDLNQSEFAHVLGVHFMQVSRWERGAVEPQAHHYIQLGKLVGKPKCWYFWGRAGLNQRDVLASFSRKNGR